MGVDQQFLEQRAISLATVLLTRQRDVIVDSLPQGTFDLIVRIPENGVFTGKELGVELKSRRLSTDLGTDLGGGCIELRETLRTSLAKQALVLRHLQIPLLYLAFAMQDERAYFGW